MSDHTITVKLHDRVPPRPGRPSKLVAVASCSGCRWQQSRSWLSLDQIDGAREELRKLGEQHQVEENWRSIEDAILERR
jgi:hypothetical protein